MEKKYDVIVVGGGASGLMAAGVAAERGKRVLIIEKNKVVGKKLSMTGGGRCNITNAEHNVHKLLKNYGKAEQYLYSAFSQFGVEDTFSFFERLGLPLVVQAKNRAFPETEDANDVVRVLKKYCTKSHVTIKSGIGVSKILHEDKRIVGVEVGDEKYLCDSLVLATGGVSQKDISSTGDGFSWLRDLGHTVEEPTPNIVPLAVEEEWVKKLPGTSLSFMKINFFLDGKRQFSKTGKLLFTHFGISGPLILNSAKDVAELLKAGPVTATIDAYPDTDHGALEKRIVKVFDANKNKELKNILGEIVPDGMVPAMELLLPEIDMEKRVHSVKKEERKQLVQILKALPLTIEGLMGFDRAVVADGGVPLDEMDMRTFASKLYDNLYITGDLLHITRPSGGFSLQLCWTGGYVAGQSV